MSLPETMRAIEISRPGGPEVLRPATVPVPVPGHGQILIRVAYAGVNRPDALQRIGSVDPGIGHADQDLAVAGHRDRDRGGAQDLGPSGSADLDGTHRLGQAHADLLDWGPDRRRSGPELSGGRGCMPVAAAGGMARPSGRASEARPRVYPQKRLDRPGTSAGGAGA